MNWERAALEILIFWMLTTPHEFAHAWVASKLGDDTPRLEGRVTLNPLAHVDWIGTVLLPAVTSLMGMGFMGWGRPVNTNPSKLKFWRRGMFLVAMAGPASNIVFALVLSAVAAFVPAARELAGYAAFVSVYLALFNLVPLPPLDGSRIWLLTPALDRVYSEIARFGFLGLILLFSGTGLARWLSDGAFRITGSFLSLFGG